MQQAAITPWAISDTLTIQNISRNKRLKGTARVTAWSSCYELEVVGHSLIGSVRALSLSKQKWKNRTRKRPREEEECQWDPSVSSLHQSLNRISVWKVRVGNQLPHAVESSYQLGVCLWRDCAGMNNVYSSRAEETKLAYSAAILRAINGLADSMQQQCANAQSVAMLCGDLGIPSWLVDIRHEATHNQMPSLSVLRLAATTLMEYLHQHYWQPQFPSASESALLHHLVAYQQQQAKAAAKQKNNPTSSSPRRKRSKKSKATPTSIAFGIPGDSDRESLDDDDEFYLDGSNTHFWEPPAPALGTNFNRFAALMTTDTTKASNGKKKKKPNAPTTPPKSAPPQFSGHHHAKQFVKIGLNNLEAAHRTALLFLVHGGIGDLPPGEGALIFPTTPENEEEYFPPTEKGARKLHHQYNLLLSLIGTEWPGFLPSLLVHLVDSIVSTENEYQRAAAPAAQDAPSRQQSRLFFLESWVRYLLSGEFLEKLVSPPGTTMKKRMPKEEEDDRSKRKPAPWKDLEKLGYPLNRLCDRLESSSLPNGRLRGGCRSSSLLEEDPPPSTTTSSRLVELLGEILGPSRRVVCFGLPHTPNNTLVLASSGILAKEGTQDDMEGLLPAKNPVGATLSLSEIEAMISHGGESASASYPETTSLTRESVAQQSVDRPENQNGGRIGPTWVQCSLWEPSALGTLSGFPFSTM